VAGKVLHLLMAMLTHNDNSPSEPRPPPARSQSNAVLIAGGIVVLLLFTMCGLALISYYSNKISSSSSTGTTASSISFKAVATTSSPPTPPKGEASSVDSKLATGEQASTTSTQPMENLSASTGAAMTGSAGSATLTSSYTGDLSLLTTLGVTEFLGENSGIGSWFRTDSSQDSTNGEVSRRHLELRRGAAASADVNFGVYRQLVVRLSLQRESRSLLVL
jgi:hypothetical protein